MRLLCFLYVLVFSSGLVFGQHSLRKLSYPINTDNHDEICPVLNYEETRLFFTKVGSEDFNKTLIENNEDLHVSLSPNNYIRKLSSIYTSISGKAIYDPVSSEFNQDVWMADLDDLDLYHPPMPINNAFPNSICSNFSKDDEYVIINEFPIDGGLKAGFSYTKLMDDGRFSIPTPIKIKDFNKKGATINLGVSNDGRHLFIAMAATNDGQQDIYLSMKVLNGYYSPPVKLGPEINTRYRESTPFISQDKRRLYFASDRPGGMGGMDIYYCERLDYTYKNWSKPTLLGFPINSPHDDSHPYISLDENTIYFSSHRDGTSDIFKAKMYRDDLLDKPIGVNINIFNEEGELIQGEIFWGEAFKDEMPGFFRTNTGQYRYIINDNLPMVFKAQRRSLKADPVIVDPQELKDSSIHEVELDFFLIDHRKKALANNNNEKTKKEESVILPLTINSTVVLKNIYFARARPDVLPLSFPSLENLASVLMRRPKVKIRVEGHTDNVGVKKDLMELSWLRANSIKDFLIKKGVNPDQVSTIGYGDTRPITNNTNEKERKKNRRVEIRVIE